MILFICLLLEFALGWGLGYLFRNQEVFSLESRLDYMYDRYGRKTRDVSEMMQVIHTLKLELEKARQSNDKH